MIYLLNFTKKRIPLALLQLALFIEVYSIDIWYYLQKEKKFIVKLIILDGNWIVFNLSVNIQYGWSLIKSLITIK